MSKILPSILGIKDLNELEEFLKTIKNTNIDEIHFDIMDGIFVENKCDNLCDIPLIKEKGYISNVHLMIENPENQIAKAVELGADSITVHYEIKEFKKILEMLLKYKKDKNIEIGVSICPETDVNVLKLIIDKIDIILVMSVHPGKGGQAFMDIAYNKIKDIRNISENVRIIVDGGINNTNIKKIFEAGADSAVVGSYITKNIKNAKEKIEILNSVI